MDHQVKACYYTANYNVYGYRTDNKCITSVQPAAVVDRTTTTVSKAEHGDNLLVLVW